MTLASKTHEPQARDGDGSGDAHPDKLVWKQISGWAWESECQRFRIERFVPGLIRDIALTQEWPDRFRVQRRSPEWFGEVAPNEVSLAAAQQVCERLTT